MKKTHATTRKDNVIPSAVGGPDSGVARSVLGELRFLYVYFFMDYRTILPYHRSEVVPTHLYSLVRTAPSWLYTLAATYTAIYTSSYMYYI